MISRVWYGRTSPEKADAYEKLLVEKILPDIQNKDIPGYRGVDLLRRNIENEVEFVTIMWFDSIDSVSAFSGEDYEIAVVPPKARALLSRFDERSAHYDVKVALEL